MIGAVQSIGRLRRKTIYLSGNGFPMAIYFYGNRFVAVQTIALLVHTISIG
jgi:hypothetical protein